MDNRKIRFMAQANYDSDQEPFENVRLAEIDYIEDTDDIVIQVNLKNDEDHYVTMFFDRRELVNGIMDALLLAGEEVEA